MLVKDIIYFSHCLGQAKPGVEKTPDLLYPFINQNKNNYFVDTSENNFFSNLENLHNENNKVNDIKMNIGGDHSMAISTVSNSLNRYPDLKVIWFDAHPDINTYQESLSKNYHGMPLSFLSGLDTDKRINFIKNYLKLDNLLYIGIRDIDDFEQKIIDKYKIKYIKCSDFNNDFENCKLIIQEFIKNSNIHISFDVDCLDPKYMPSTGTRFMNGLELSLVKQILDLLHDYHLNKQIDICNLDLTEINFEIGSKLDNFNSLANVLYLFNKFI